MAKKKIIKKKSRPKFNEEQKKVIEHIDGPLLVASVAGSGKTTVLVHRIANMIKNGINENEILATTFTKKAAKEMNDRLQKLGIDTDLMQVSTFHSVCLKILKREYKLLPEYNEAFEVDGNGSMEKFTLKYVLGFQQMNWKNADFGEVKHQIGLWKNELIRPWEAQHDDPRFVEAYRLFEHFREQRGFLTFDDMLIRCWELFDRHPEVLKKYQDKWKYILIDECQDQNFAQTRIAEMIAAPENNIMMCGDIDQSIYGFRGAVPEYMLNFEKKYNSTIIKMEKNYRCQAQQLEIANKLIVKNIKRILLKLIPMTGSNGNIETSCYVDAEEEAFYIKEKIKQLINEGYKYKDFAILYRTNAQSRALEDEMIKEGIPYELVGGINFYQRREIKDILAYVKGALGIDADKNLRRVVNVPFRYLGKAFIEMVENHMYYNKCSFEQALGEVPCKTNQLNSVNDFLSIVNYIRQSYEFTKPDELLQTVVDRTNYINFLKREEGENEEENSRIVNVKELIRAASKYHNIMKFLEYIKLMQKKTKQDETKPNKVVLSTLHRSKGLEWPVVFIAGLNEGILPHGKAEDIEEERRLCYVGFTRSKERLYLSHLSMTPFGKGRPSRFLFDSDLIKEVGSEEEVPISCEGI